VLKADMPSKRQMLIALAALLGATCVVGVLDSARASTTPRDEDLFFRRFRGADEVDNRGGRDGSGSSGVGQSSGGGSGGSSSGSSGGGNSGGRSSSGSSGSSGGGNSSGSGNGGSSGGNHNEKDDDDRFKK
jgi:hypothetical protein